MSNMLFKVVLILFVLSFAIGCPTMETGRGANEPETKKDKENRKSEYPPAPKALAESELKALDAEDFKIADFKGKVVLINLWATWCAPCLEEMPYFIELQDKYRDEGLVIVGLNSDEESKAQVKAFVKQQKLNYKIGWANKAVVDEFMKISQLPGIPQSLLINRKGEMTGLFRGGGKTVIATMVETVEKMMAEKESA